MWHLASPKGLSSRSRGAGPAYLHGRLNATAWEEIRWPMHRVLPRPRPRQHRRPHLLGLSFHSRPGTFGTTQRGLVLVGGENEMTDEQKKPKLVIKQPTKDVRITQALAMNLARYIDQVVESIDEMLRISGARITPSAKKALSIEAAVKKALQEKPTAKRAHARQATAKKVSAAKSVPKKAAARKAPARKSAAKRAAAKKAAAKSAAHKP